MSRIAPLGAVLCAVLMTAACGSTTTSPGGASNASLPTSSGAGTASSGAGAPTGALPTGAPPDGVWRADVAAGQLLVILKPFSDARSAALDADNAFAKADAPAPDQYAAAFAPVSRLCQNVRDAAGKAAADLTATHAAGHWTPRQWALVSRYVPELRWYVSDFRGCTQVRSLMDLAGWTVDMDVKRINRWGALQDRVFGGLKRTYAADGAPR